METVVFPHLDDDVRADRQRMILVVQRDVIDQRVVQGASVGNQLVTDRHTDHRSSRC